MRQRVLVALMAAAGVAGATTMAAAGPAAAMPTGSRVTAAADGWGQAALLPGTGQLGQDGAYGSAVSCPSTGNCTAGGSFDRGGAEEVFVISERNGRWGTVGEVPGLVALNTGGSAELTAISCASPGNCVATGTYLRTGDLVPYVAVQKSWRWGKAESIPGLGGLNIGRFASVWSVSCGSPGNCAVGGSYLDGSSLTQAYVVTLSNWHWTKAAEVPGTATLNAGGSAELTAISCRKAGNCSAAGSYRPRSTTASAFVITENNGRWGNATQVPGLALLNAGGGAFPVALSCGSPGNCAVGGYYHDAAGLSQVFLATQKSGHWNKAAQAPGTGALNVGGSAEVTAISCPSAGNCSAGGFYARTSGHLQLFVTTERKGTWGTAAALPGILSHNKGTSTQIYSLSCGSAGNCSASGYYENAAFREFAFVSTESGGRWGSVTEVPGIGGVSPGGDSGVSQVSCPSAGHCVGVGYATSAAHKDQAFYVRRT